MGASSTPGTSQVIPALGLTWSNFINTRLMLRRTNYQLKPSKTEPRDKESVTDMDQRQDYMVAVRSMEIVFAPNLPNKLIYYVVEEDGVKGLR